MVTARRARLAERAVRCFLAQTYHPRELVIIDDGDEDYAPMLGRMPAAAPIHYHRVRHNPDRKLGALRNVSLDRANGDYVTQWDDDEWCHPERIERQVAALEGGFDASVLRYTLMHLDDPIFVDHPYRTGLRNGTPGTILHRRTDVRYPNRSMREDSDFAAALRRRVRVRIMREGASHLFIRCFHGANTWQRQHFAERLHYNLGDKVQYAYAVIVRRDVFAHPAFQLTALERAAYEMFLQQSRELGLIVN